MKKKQNKISIAYDESTIYHIYEIYQKHDSKKFNKYMRAVRKMDEMEGWGMKILHHSAYNFSCAFLYMDEKKQIRLYYIGMNNSEMEFKYYE